MGECDMARLFKHGLIGKLVDKNDKRRGGDRKDKPTATTSADAPLGKKAVPVRKNPRPRSNMLTED
jgi:hypothetical protein